VTAAAPGPRSGRERADMAVFYLGGFLGPFGGGVLVVLVPELTDVFDASTAAVTAGITVYVLPFAALQLVSGTIGERLGRGRTIRWAYLSYAVTSFGAALAPGIAAFLAMRSLQGASNAFTSPLLLAALAEASTSERLGRSMGTFASVQTAGMVMAPLCGGLIGAIDPRLAFAVPGLAALVLALAPLPAGAHARRTEPARLRDAFNRRSSLVAAAGFLAFLAINGVAFLVALRAADRFGLDTTARGLLLAGFGLAGVLAGRPAGGLVDRFGPRPVVLAGALVSGAMIGVLGLAGSVVALAAAWFAAGVASQFIWAGLNTLAVRSTPENRGGAISVVGAFKFAGNAVAPLVWLPIYLVRPSLAFALAGGAAALIALVVQGVRPPAQAAEPPDERARAAAAAQH
jgi:MFS family permease